MENLYINWRGILFVIVFLFISFQLLKNGFKWMIESHVIAKTSLPADISVQGYLYWIGMGLKTIFWLIFLFLAFFLEKV